MTLLRSLLSGTTLGPERGGPGDLVRHLATPEAAGSQRLGFSGRLTVRCCGFRSPFRESSLEADGENEGISQHDAGHPEQSRMIE